MQHAKLYICCIMIKFVSIVSTMVSMSKQYAWHNDAII